MNNFYSKNWLQMNKTVIYSRPHYDFLIDDSYFYLIKISDYNYGLFTFLFFGFAESIFGDSVDSKKREEYRSSWVDSDGNIISNNFENNIFLKIPLVDLSKSLFYKENGIIYSGLFLNYGDHKIRMSNNKKEYKRLLGYLDKVGIKIIS